MSILIKNGRVIYGESLEIMDADVYVEGNKIVKVGKGLKESADVVIDAKGKVISPGFINTHTHLAMTLFRGLADDLPLMEWLQNHIWPLERKLTPKDIYWGSLLGALEMIKSGTTTFVDMYFHMDEVANAVNEAGLRAYLTYGVVDLSSEEKAESEIKEALRTLKFIQKLNSDRIEFIFGPHAPYTCSPGFLRRIRELADEHGKMVTIHVSETKTEVEQIKEQYGKSPVELLDEIGFLRDDVIIAHGVWLSEKDISILKKRGVTVAHNPASNMKLASGVMPLRELLEAGVNVSLATDGDASNNNLDMLEEMKLAALLHKVHTLDPTIANAYTVFKMATQNGAKALKLNTGVIKEGALADLVIIDFNKPHLRPIHNIISHLVYSANGSDVETTIVNGKILMLDREVLSFDEEKVLDKAQKVAEDLLSR
ncbi:N-ethylammeline chlorohydrolase [Palaeococcus pacificus DY20341]|uniref:5-methylthioadenosine/S-adenosylhomocysteine deaminase n=1 Tax=Palaeococcus pacificus DY20341 TaxID=1343739 RepID=A0A075LVK0_9EURY|nr:amidohydrolase family protein [Palaeococcus pacificus]AIF68498.1 N-ethylammeline chlorohydrolase [Palaeococcus pacificus DY20341]